MRARASLCDLGVTQEDARIISSHRMAAGSTEAGGLQEICRKLLWTAMSAVPSPHHPPLLETITASASPRSVEVIFPVVLCDINGQRIRVIHPHRSLNIQISISLKPKSIERRGKAYWIYHHNFILICLNSILIFLAFESRCLLVYFGGRYSNYMHIP